MNKAIVTVLLAAVFAALTAQPEAMAQEQTIYKWVDAEGVVHYTARPPEDVDYEEVGIETREPVESATEGGETQDEEADTTNNPPEQPEMTQSRPDPEVMAERCAQARTNLESMNRYSNLTVEGDDGEQRPVSDAERREMIEETQQFIDEWC